MNRITLLVALVLVTLAGSWIASRQAGAQQSAPFAATIYVPSDGIAFRTFDGHLVARLSYGDHGGLFETYDEHEELRPVANTTPPTFLETVADLPPLRKPEIQVRVRNDSH